MIRIDDAIPGGNAATDFISGDEVSIRPDMRDTEGWWFYWYFRVLGAAGRELTFYLDSDQPMVSELGPAVSFNGGVRWRWLGGEFASGDSFRLSVPDGCSDARLSMGMPYTLGELRAFLARLDKCPAAEVGELTRTRKKRPVYMVRAGKLSGEPRFRMMLTARHHCCEMMASYAVEGLLESMVGDTDTGRWFREHVEALVVPFVDTDGVEDGDQGKNRRPRDHNRDYSGKPVHIETAAIRQFVPVWSEEQLCLAFDLHCPFIRGRSHSSIHIVGSSDPQIWKEQQRFGRILETVRKGPLPYYTEDNLAFGQDWNTGANFGEGRSFSQWAARLDGMKIASSFEIPYSAAHGVELNGESCRLFGQDLAQAIRHYLD